MSDPNAPRALISISGDFIPKIIDGLTKLAPYLIVCYAIWSANHGADEKVWTPILIAGSALIDPRPLKGGGDEG